MGSHSRTNTRVRVVFDRDEAINFVADAFAQAYPVGPAKRVANDLKVSHRTVEGWASRRVAMSLPQFLNAIQVVPELRAAVRSLVGLQSDSAKFQRALADLMRTMEP